MILQTTLAFQKTPLQSYPSAPCLPDSGKQAVSARSPDDPPAAVPAAPSLKNDTKRSQMFSVFYTLLPALPNFQFSASRQFLLPEERSHFFSSLLRNARIPSALCACAIGANCRPWHISKDAVCKFLSFTHLQLSFPSMLSICIRLFRRNAHSRSANRIDLCAVPNLAQAAPGSTLPGSSR